MGGGGGSKKGKKYSAERRCAKREIQAARKRITKTDCSRSVGEHGGDREKWDISH